MLLYLFAGRLLGKEREHFFSDRKRTKDCSSGYQCEERRGQKPVSTAVRMVERYEFVL